MRFVKSALITAAALAMPLLSQAGSISTTGTLTVGSLTFSNFNCRFSGNGAYTPGSCDNINVNTITMPGTGIQFTSGFSTYGTAKDGSGSLADATVAYVASNTVGMKEVGLSFDGNFYGQAIAAVTETIWNNGVVIGKGTVRCGSGDAGCSQSTEILLNGTYNSFYVEKDILLASYAAGSGSYASVVDQTFDSASAPEPASIAMLGGGLLGVAGFLRRRKAAAKA